jgi:hypothetical protein
MGAEMNKYIIQYDLRKYQGRIKNNKIYAENPIEAESIDAVKDILRKEKNLNPFYFLIIPIEQFKTIVDSQDHNYKSLSEKITRF